jgi:cobyrinic acid a,c-diamide synthase
VSIPERHLGLHLPGEVRADHAEELATLIESSVDLDQLLGRTRMERPPVPPRAPLEEPRARIGVARDEAFCFYYTDNLELLCDAGAELEEFSPLRDTLPTDIDGLYLGGGYPELHAGALAANTTMTSAIRDFAGAGGPIYAECGGLMYLAERLRVDDAEYPLCGALPFGTTMGAPLKIAYVEVETTGGLFGPGMRARGHLFHHSEIVGGEPGARTYRLRTSQGDERTEGYQERGVLASYVHLHFASEPKVAVALVDRCHAFRTRRQRPA